MARAREHRWTASTGALVGLARVAQHRPHRARLLAAGAVPLRTRLLAAAAAPLRTRLLATAALLLSACGRETPSDAPASPAARPPEIRDAVILLLDALPAHLMSCYGLEQPTTPEIDRFAAASLRCEAAYSPAAFTLASVAGLFTAIRPAALGVLGVASNVLPATELTLAEAFESAGFATGAWSCNGHVCAEAGFDQGFASFHSYAHGGEGYHTVPAELVPSFLEWWRAHAGQRRFVYIHLLPPHQPYDPPPPFDTAFGADASTREQGSSAYLEALSQERKLTPSDPRVQAIRKRYLAGLHYVDSVVGELVRGFDAAGGFEHCAFALLSDHGEGFAEHGQILHSSNPHAEMTRVPLILRWPGLGAGVQPAVLSTLDLGPTLAELLDVGFPERPEGGRSLLPLLRGAAGASGSPVIARAAGARPWWALRTEQWSLVLSHDWSVRRLYDRRADPEESRDLGREQGAIVNQLRQQLLERIARDEAAAHVAPGATRAREDELKKIGYGDGAR